MSKKKVVLIVVVSLIVWTIITKVVWKKVVEFKNSFSLPKATSEEYYKMRDMEKEIAELKKLVEQQQKSDNTDSSSAEEKVVETQSIETQSSVSNSEYVIVLPYGTEIYQLGYDIYDVIALTDYLSESNGYITRRPYDSDNKDVYCPEDTVVLREKSTGKYKLIVFQGFGTRPE